MTQTQLPDSTEQDQSTLDLFLRLVKDLKAALSPSFGIGSAEVNTQDLEQRMRDYISHEPDWSHFALADGSANYSRNLVDQGNGRSNLLILVWNPMKGSAIHDHAGAHCIMKILKGSLEETRYTWPDQRNPSPPTATHAHVFRENEVSYMSDQLGLHTISNPDPSNVAVSLHRRYTFNLLRKKKTDPLSVYSSQRCHVWIQHIL